MSYKHIHIYIYTGIYIYIDDDVCVNILENGFYSMPFCSVLVLRFYSVRFVFILVQSTR